MQAQIDYVQKGKQITLYGDELSADGTEDQWRVAQYTISSRKALRRKLAQYPPGTVFAWDVSDSDRNLKLTRKSFPNFKLF